MVHLVLNYQRAISLTRRLADTAHHGPCQGTRCNSASTWRCVQFRRWGGSFPGGEQRGLSRRPWQLPGWGMRVAGPPRRSPDWWPHSALCSLGTERDAGGEGSGVLASLAPGMRSDGTKGAWWMAQLWPGPVTPHSVPGLACRWPSRLVCVPAVQRCPSDAVPWRLQPGPLLGGTCTL